MRDNYEERLKLVQDKQHEIRTPMKSDENVNSVNDVENTHYGKIKKKLSRDIKCVVLNDEENKHCKKPHGYGGNDNNSAVKINGCGD